jgi:hypothetical protein
MKMTLYHSSPAFRARVLMRSRKWAAENPERRQNIQATYNKRRRSDPLTWAKYSVGAIRIRSGKKGLPFNLTAADIRAAIPSDMKCPALGIVMTFGGNGFNRNTASVDRIIPELGYVVGNIAVISLWANLIKQDVSSPNMLRAVADYMEKFSPKLQDHPNANGSN